MLIAGSNAVARGLAGSLKSHGVKSLLVDTDPYSVTRAIAAGLPARRMSVLAEEAARDLDLRGIGRLLACTSNDEVNALATARFVRVFGRREVFQLAPTKLSAGGASVPEEYLGRVIGIQPITYAALDERTRSGWRVASVSGGSTVSNAAADGEFMPMVRVVDGKMAFLCRNDPIPSDGHVIGLAAPPFLERLS